MRKLFYILILISFSEQVLGQRTPQENTEIKEILKDNKFTVTKSKIDVPLTILNKVGIFSLNEIANPTEDWSPGCVKKDKNSPTVKLNWAAKNKSDIWFICLDVRGGFAGAQTHVFLLLANKQIVLEGTYATSFKSFKMAFLTDKPVKF